MIDQQGAHGVAGNAQQVRGAQLVETAVGKSLARNQILDIVQQRIAGNMDATDAAKLLEGVGMLESTQQKQKRRYCWQNVRPKAGGPQVVAYKMRHAPEEE